MHYLRSIVNRSSGKFIKETTMRLNIHPIKTYKDAIDTLNNLQSNTSYIRNAPKHDAINRNLEDMWKYLSRSGINIKQLDELSIIHVAGTKGKGSTCAYIESILREHGFKTGLYTSPHLVHVRERIVLNGRPISEELFTNYFANIYEKLMNQRQFDDDMPAYFKFITLMMFHIFLNSSIDVAIIEVGIGGKFDCTNIVENPVCVGITKLDLDHISLLGDNLKLIADQKSGIFKKNTPAFTVPQQTDAMATLIDRAVEKNCKLSVVPKISDYLFKNNPPKLGIPAEIQYYNASLAIQLSNVWLCLQKNYNKLLKNNEKLLLDMDKVEVALENCKWPGRTQLLRGRSIDFYLDGAHTVESMAGCIEWFLNSTSKNKKRRRILLFNVMGNRNAKLFLNMLKSLNFHSAFFVPNISGIIKNNNTDECHELKRNNAEFVGCEIHCRYWGDDGFNATSVAHAFNLIKQKYQLNDSNVGDDKIDLLITGSLHLVGAALTVLDPDLTMTTNY